MGWATFWATFSQTHLVTLFETHPVTLPPIEFSGRIVLM
jgi:hypothetical protein